MIYCRVAARAPTTKNATAAKPASTGTAGMESTTAAATVATERIIRARMAMSKCWRAERGEGEAL